MTDDGLHTQACLEYAAKTRRSFCIAECADARRARSKQRTEPAWSRERMEQSAKRAAEITEEHGEMPDIGGGSTRNSSAASCRCVARIEEYLSFVHAQINAMREVPEGAIFLHRDVRTIETLLCILREQQRTGDGSGRRTEEASLSVLGSEGTAGVAGSTPAPSTSESTPDGSVDWRDRYLTEVKRRQHVEDLLKEIFDAVGSHLARQDLKDAIADTLGYARRV